MIFEYDGNKSQSNKIKHGIDFIEAQQLFEDNKMVELKSSFENEDRYLNIGRINNKFYTVVTTYRDDKIRIISARRSRKKEIEIYES